MVDILHQVGVKAAPEAVFAAVTSVDGLAGWWTEKTSGDTAPGGVIEFRFGPGGFDMKVLESAAPARLTWEVVDGPEEWVGTRIHWDLRSEDEWTIVNFKHEGWREPVDFMHHCSTKWATFLLSLKELVETGTGRPDPRDVKVTNWN
jgi:uncharacterized protein YndB with AHSA1/START domain